MFFLPWSFLATWPLRMDSMLLSPVRKSEAKETSHLLEENQIQELLKYPRQWCLMNTTRSSKRTAQCHCKAMLLFLKGGHATSLLGVFKHSTGQSPDMRGAPTLA